MIHGIGLRSCLTANFQTFYIFAYLKLKIPLQTEITDALKISLFQDGAHFLFKFLRSTH